MSDPIMIIGGGHQGLAMAAHLSLNGIKCYLWNRTESNIREIIETGEISCEGVVQGVAHIEHASTDIAENLQKVIMVTTPSSAHKDIAKLLAPYVDESYTIVLNPGRTFGALEFAKVLKQNGCCSLPKIAETQTIVYTCRREKSNAVAIYAMKKDVLISTVDKSNLAKILDKIPECMKQYLKPTDSFIETSLGNVGMVLHCAPVLMNIGWIENDKVDFKYYYEGISSSIARFLEKIDAERVAVSKAMGNEVETLVEWLKRTYGTTGDSLFECLQNNKYYANIDAPLSIHHRYLDEDVPNGLVPVESAGKVFNIETPNISLVIDLANAVMECDYREIGRLYDCTSEICL